MKKTGNKKIIALIVVALVTIGSVLSTQAYNYQILNAYQSVSAYESIDKSQSGLSQHSKKINEMNNKLVMEDLEDVMVTITFRKPLGLEDLKTYVQEHNVDIVQLQYRAVQKDGTRVTGVTKTTDGLDATDLIAREMSDDSNARFVGYISMYALVDSVNLKKAISDKKTYLIDASADLYFQGKTRKNGKARNIISGIEKNAGRYPMSLAWDLENLAVISEEQTDVVAQEAQK